MDGVFGDLHEQFTAPAHLGKLTLADIDGYSILNFEANASRQGQRPFEQEQNLVGALFH
jgi:hypothetical protein